MKAPTKAEAKTAAAKELDQVVSGQPAHKVDRAAAGAVVDAFIDALAEPQENDEYQVSVNGSVSWSSENVYTGVEVTARVYLRNKI